MDSAPRETDGVVPARSLGAHPRRAAERDRLEQVVPGAYVAVTQPVDARVIATALVVTRSARYAFVGATALWIYGIGPQPQAVEIGVPHSTRMALGDAVVVRRLSAAVLHGTRTVDGRSVVSLEVAVIQAAASRSPGEVAELVGRVLRARRTTAARLISRCRRGVSGAAAVRAAIDELGGGSLDRSVRRLRQALERRGVNGLETEVHFVSEDNASCYVDLLHRPTATAFELDGFLSHTERQRFRADRRRDRWMQAQHGVLTVRIDVADDTERVADDLCVILQRRGWQRPIAA